MAATAVKTNAGLEKYRVAVEADTVTMAWGTGTTPPTVADTSLQTEVLSKAATHPGSTGAGEAVHSGRILLSEANGSNLTEVSLKDGAAALLARITHQVVAKDNTFELVYRIIEKVKNA